MVFYLVVMKIILDNQNKYMKHQEMIMDNGFNLINKKKKGWYQKLQLKIKIVEISEIVQ